MKKIIPLIVSCGLLATFSSAHADITLDLNNGEWVKHLSYTQDMSAEAMVYAPSLTQRYLSLYHNQKTQQKLVLQENKAMLAAPGQEAESVYKSIAATEKSNDMYNAIMDFAQDATQLNLPQTNTGLCDAGTIHIELMGQEHQIISSCGTVTDIPAIDRNTHTLVDLLRSVNTAMAHEGETTYIAGETETTTATGSTQPSSPSNSPYQYKIDLNNSEWKALYTYTEKPSSEMNMAHTVEQNHLAIYYNQDTFETLAILENTLHYGLQEMQFSVDHQPLGLPKPKVRYTALSLTDHPDLMDQLMSMDGLSKHDIWGQTTKMPICDRGDVIITYQDKAAHRIVSTCSPEDAHLANDLQPAIELDALLNNLQQQTHVKGTAAQVIKAIEPAAETAEAQQATTVESTNPALKRRYSYTGRWRAGGICTASLISPSWALTAKHCIGSKVRSGKRKAHIDFGMAAAGKGTVRRQAMEFHVAKKADVALVRLAKPLYSVEPVKLLANPITKKHGYLNMTVIGKTNNTIAHQNRKVKRSRRGTGLYHSKQAGEKTRPGKAGYSGGPWVLEDENIGHVQIGVNHGGGFAPQVASLKNWINRTMASSAENPLWVERKQLQAFQK